MFPTDYENQNPLTKKKIKVEELSEIERLLYESYRKIDVDFTFNEVTTLKLKLTDDKFYFHTEFSFLLFFNNSIFTDNINQIYKNFNSKIESFINSSSDKKFFNVLLIIDDEIETLKSFVASASNIPIVEAIYFVPYFHEENKEERIEVTTIWNSSLYYNGLLTG